MALFFARLTTESEQISCWWREERTLLILFAVISGVAMLRECMQVTYPDKKNSITALHSEACGFHQMRKKQCLVEPPINIRLEMNAVKVEAGKGDIGVV